MKKLSACFVAVLFSIISLAQVADVPEATETHSYTAAGFGYYFLPMAGVKAHYTDMGVNAAGQTMMIGVGIDRGYNTITNKLDHGITGMLSFHYLLPLNFKSAGDSVKVAFNGYNAQFDLLGANYLQSEIFTLTGTLGWAFGRIKVTEETLAGKSVFLNKYFAPEGRFEFNVRLAEHFYLGVRYAYRADITKTRWTRTGANTKDLPGTNMSGTMLGAFIGYGK